MQPPLIVIKGYKHLHFSFISITHFGSDCYIELR
jgi:hypothetical protein